MIDLVWTTPALAYLRTIDSWLTREARGDVAVRVLTAIRTRARSLREFPHIGRRVGHRDVRTLRVLGTAYLIVYRPLGDHVEVLRVRHEREDWQVET